TVDSSGRVCGGVLSRGWGRLRGRPTFSLLGLLERTERTSADELAALRSGGLRRLVRHAYHHTAYYRRVLDDAGVHPDDIRTPADLALVPLLDRATAQITVDQRTPAWPPV